MPILRRKLKCHYCGNQQTHRHQGPPRVWGCTSCGADNHIDKDGQIADPPAQESTAAPRFAHPVAKDFGHGGQSTDPSIFCTTCIKNQGIQNELLAQYLPAPDHPTYAQSEAGLDTYRRRLEEDYPQVCIDCENRVLQRIQVAEYKAKSDNLKRMMEQSRKYRLSPTYGWRHHLVWIGMVGYYSSLAAQILWSALVLMTGPGIQAANDQTAETDFSKCLSQMQNDFSIHAACADLGASMAGVAMVVSFLTIWWNPKWQHKIEGRRGRLSGLKDFYQLQAGSLIVRFLAWVLLQDLHANLSLPVTRAIHAFLLCMNLLLVLAPWYIVKVEKLAAFSRASAPLIPESVRARQVQERKQLADLRTQDSQSFPLWKLSGAPTANDFSYVSPTPPEDVPEADSMEWEPTHNLHIRRQQQVQNISPQRSPFYGRLPPQPNNHRLNPHPQAAQISQRDSIGLPPGFFDPPTNSSISPSSSQDTGPPTRGFAQPQFFGPSADSGLEGFFGRVFNLNDQPFEASVETDAPTAPFQSGDFHSALKVQSGTSAIKTSTSQTSAGKLRSLHLTLMSLLGLALGFLFLSSSPFVAPTLDPSKSNAAIIALAVLTSLTSVLQRSINFGWQGTVFFIAELLASIVLGFVGVVKDFDFEDKYQNLLRGLLGIMFWQEFFLGMSAQIYNSGAPSAMGDLSQNTKSIFKQQTPGGLGTIASNRNAKDPDGVNQSSQSAMPNTSDYPRPQQVSSESSPRKAPNLYSRLQQSPQPPFSDPVPQQKSSQSSNPSPFIHRPPYQHISGSQSSDASRVYQRRDSFSTDTSSPDSEDSNAPTVTTGGAQTPKFQQSRYRTAYSPGTGLVGLSLEDSGGPPSTRLRNRARF